MEGLAISPDGSRLIGMMQSPLIQDGGLNAANSRVGLNVRILDLDLDRDPLSGASRQYVYTLDAASNGISEIVAVDANRFLVLERDGRIGPAAAQKRIFLADLTGASDVSGVALPTSGLPPDVTKVSKTLFLDLLDPAFGLAGPDFPEKIEGLAFGPDLPDGDHLLLVTVDNDFSETLPTRIYAFAIDPAVLPGLARQVLQPFVDFRPKTAKNIVRLSHMKPTFKLMIFSDGLFDATHVDPASVTFAGAPVKTTKKGEPKFDIVDFDNDGRDDLRVVIDGTALSLPLGVQVVPVEGRAFSGTPLRTEEFVHVKP